MQPSSCVRTLSKGFVETPQMYSVESKSGSSFNLGMASEHVAWLGEPAWPSRGGQKAATQGQHGICSKFHFANLARGTPKDRKKQEGRCPRWAVEARQVLDLAGGCGLKRWPGAPGRGTTETETEAEDVPPPPEEPLLLIHRSFFHARMLQFAALLSAISAKPRPLVLTCGR